jgi:hypothetical protein
LLVLLNLSFERRYFLFQFFVGRFCGHFEISQSIKTKKLIK